LSVDGEEPAAVGRAEVLRIAVPGTAADNTPTAITGCPSGAVRGRARIAVAPAICGPLRRIALHIVKAETVRREASNRRRIHVTVIAGRDGQVLGSGNALRRLVCPVAVAAQILLVIAE
jgi:hypothetical protein